MKTFAALCGRVLLWWSIFLEGVRHMGQVADKINALEAKVTSLTTDGVIKDAQIAALAAQLAAAPVLDAADTAAVAGVDAFLNPPTA